MWNLQGEGMRERERERENKVFITYKSTLLSGCCYSTVQILADLLEMAIRIFCQQKPFANDKLTTASCLMVFLPLKRSRKKIF